MTAVNEVKCACPSCVCVTTLSDAISKGGQYFCSSACAEGHPNGTGCGHKGCECNN
jgi:hypothetical protein